MSYLFFIIIFILSTTHCVGQVVNKCETMEYIEYLMSIDPLLELRLENMNYTIEEYLQDQPEPIQGSTPQVFRIPVVVHVLWNEGSQNIGYPQIQSQIDILNQDYAYSHIEFYLAKISPEGEESIGFEDSWTSITEFSRSGDKVKFSNLGGTDAWDTQKYLNIWVCKLSGGVLGYSPFPGAAPERDGVVIDYRAFGNTGTALYPNNQGRTATHEVGHYLYLYHTWGDRDDCSGTDYVDDTPPCSGAYWAGSPGYETCGGNVFQCGGRRQIENYMDYSDDRCMNMFTGGQDDRIRATLTLYRNELYQKISVRVDQLAADGVTSVGNISHWEAGSFIDYQAPAVFRFNVNSGETFRSYQNVINNQKYFIWQNQSDILNHRTFSVDPINSSQKALFKDTYPNIVIKTEIEGSTAYNGGSIEFKDPWLVDYPDPSFNNNKRNQGMSAPFKPRTSPFYTDFSTLYNLTDIYNGVLLNQYVYLGNYYSIKVPLEQNIGVFHCHFIDWQATGAGLYQVGTSPSGYDQKAVVFTSTSPITIKARYNAVSASIDAPVLAAWNMTSIPDVVGNFGSTSVYPTAISPVYAYQNGYVPKTTLQVGEGYWVKFGPAQAINYTGTPIFQGNFAVTQGWNIIGSISVPVSTSTIAPQTNIATPFYKYNNGYVITNVVEPGGGYWVKVNASGTIQLQAPLLASPPNSISPIDRIEALVSTLDEFTIIDNEGKQQSLYVRNGSVVSELEGINFEMPPPPTGADFDARFLTEKLVEAVYPEDGETALSISINTDAYPVTVTYDIKPENGINYSIGVNSDGMGKISLSKLNDNSGNYVINNASNGKVSLVSNAHYVSRSELPKEYVLGQNYPNPFNPTTVINYQLPENGYVTLKIYDVLGKEVVTLVNEHKEAGYYEASFDATHLSSGVYFYKLTSGSYTSVNKMLLTR